VAQTLTNKHFFGADQPSAARRLCKAIYQVWWARYGGRTEKQDTVAEMAHSLRCEGWKPLFDDDYVRCFWLHESGITVNANGGYFYCYEEATRRTYESHVRALLAT